MPPPELQLNVGKLETLLCPFVGETITAGKGGALGSTLVKV